MSAQDKEAAPAGAAPAVDDDPRKNTSDTKSAGVVSGEEATYGAARDYAWRWFEYHAGQRQAVFRFYTLLIAASVTGFVGSSGNDSLRRYAYIFGGVIAVMAVLFYRLDRRSVFLVKIAEDYLKIEEARLSRLIENYSGAGVEEIRIASNSDQSRVRGLREAFAKGRAPDVLKSFSQIYGTVFALTGLGGLYIFLVAGGESSGATAVSLFEWAAQLLIDVCGAIWTFLQRFTSEFMTVASAYP